jgi:ABC-type transport system involved in multi-copper enzyme maturation permease subunit
MTMLLGPVFRAELLRTARRARYYVLRLLYGGLLLLVVWAIYDDRFHGRSTISIRQVAEYAGATFYTFAIVQLVTVLVLVPALFAGTITDEKQRKTLHYLMASRLTSREIVLDKVLARAAHLAVFLAIGLPVIMILGFFGGIAPEDVAFAYVGTISTTGFALGIAVLVSTLARRVRQAVLITYLLIFAWMFAPVLIEALGQGLYRGEYAMSWIRPAVEWLLNTSPLGVFVLLVQKGPPLNTSTMIDDVGWMVGLQLCGMLLMLLSAIWRLRPAFRRQEETPAWTTLFRARRGRRRRTSHPECGEDALLWKERYFAPSDIFTKLVLLPSIVLVTLPLILMTEFEGGLGDFVYSLWRDGFSTRNFALGNLAWALRVYLGWYTAFWLLAVACASASSVTIERERDAWVSLTASPLAGWEILRAKVLGAIWNQRGFGAVMLFVLFAAVASMAVDAKGVLTSFGLLAVLTWMVAVLGLYASLHYHSTSRALAATIVALCILNGYPLMLFESFLSRLHWESSFSLLGAMPWLAASPLALQSPRSEPWRASPWVHDQFVTSHFESGYVLGLLAIYLALALFLTWRMASRFDHWLDRPSSPCVQRAVS